MKKEAKKKKTSKKFKHSKKTKKQKEETEKQEIKEIKKLDKEESNLEEDIKELDKQIREIQPERFTPTAFPILENITEIQQPRNLTAMTSTAPIKISEDDEKQKDYLETKKEYSEKQKEYQTAAASVIQPGRLDTKKLGRTKQELRTASPIQQGFESTENPEYVKSPERVDIENLGREKEPVVREYKQ